MIRFLWKIFILVSFSTAFAQDDIQFEQLSLEHGLSQSTVRCIYQDSRGFMWFGTWDGLNRYDGYEFTVYKHDADDSTSLSAKSILSLAEDRFGNLWVGTTNGLNLFNRESEKFTRFFADTADSLSIADNSIWSILIDESDAMWLGTMHGLDKVIFSQDENDRPLRIVHYEHDPLDASSVSSNHIKSVYQDPFDRLWIGTWDNSLNLFNRDTETFVRYYHQADRADATSHYAIRDLAADPYGNLWIATHYGLNKLLNSSPDAKIPIPSFVHYFADSTNPTALSHNMLLSLCLDQSGKLWIGTLNKGLNCYDPNLDLFKRYQHEPANPQSLSHNDVYSIYEDRAGVLWFGTFGGGINKYFPKQKKFRHYKTNPENPRSLSHNFTSIIQEDSAGDLWIGTWGGGLNRLLRENADSDPPAFIRYRFNPNDPGSVNSNTVLSMCESQSGDLWFGTWEAGLNRFDRRTGKFESYSYKMAAPNDGNFNKVFAILEDSNGFLWLRTTGAGLVGFDPITKTFSLYNSRPKDPFSLSGNQISCIFKDRADRIWVGTQNDGLNMLVADSLIQDQKNAATLKKQSISFLRIKCNPNDVKSLSHNSISTIYQARSGVLWIGTNGGGLNCFDMPSHSSQNGMPISPQITRYEHDPTDPASINGNYIGEICQDRTGVLWVEANGLNKLDETSGSFIRYGDEYGLADVDILRILEDDAGNLWIVTATGLCKFNPLNETIRHYDTYDGLQSKEFNTNAHCRRKNGEIIIGGVNGYNAFFPENIKDEPHAPPIVFTDFLLSNESVNIGSRALSESIVEEDELTLSYKDRLFSFEFAALHFACPQKNQYAYKMDGLDDDWNYIGARRFTTFTNLSPGKYTFRVKASNCDGVWNEEGKAINIMIMPPWWKTPLAYFVYVLLGSASLWALIGFVVSRSVLKRQLALEHDHAVKLQDLDRMKSRFFANISHEFRTPLTLIIGPLEKLLSENLGSHVDKQLKLMLRNGQRLLRLISQLLDLSKMESGNMSITASPENIVEIVQTTVRFFTSWAERKNIQLTFVADVENMVIYTDRDKVEKIFSNLLSNAFKFTPEGGEISVRLSTKKDFVEISVTDTGPGIDADLLEKIFDRFYQSDDSQTRDYEGTGIGLALTKELVELHHGEIRVKSPPEHKEHGTAFVVRFKHGKEHFEPRQIIEHQAADTKTPAVQSVDVDDGKIMFDNSVSDTNMLAPLLLVVEDNDDVRQYIRDILQNEYRIKEAADGRDGIAAAVNEIPDLIISDVMMPKMDGIAMCRTLKNDERTSHIPVILLTARASGDSKVEGLETGADDYLTKPFDAKELQVRAQNLIDGRQLLRQKFSREITLRPKDIAVTSMDESFLQRVMDTIEKNISESDFTTDILATQVGMSRMQLNRKLQALTGQPTREFITTMRLKRAMQLLQGGAGTVSEIVYDVGFNSLSHFAKVFRQQFGESPSEYAARFRDDG